MIGDKAVESTGRTVGEPIGDLRVEVHLFAFNIHALENRWIFAAMRSMSFIFLAACLQCTSDHNDAQRAAGNFCERLFADANSEGLLRDLEGEWGCMPGWLWNISADGTISQKDFENNPDKTFAPGRIFRNSGWFVSEGKGHRGQQLRINKITCWISPNVSRTHDVGVILYGEGDQFILSRLRLSGETPKFLAEIKLK